MPFTSANFELTGLYHFPQNAAFFAYTDVTTLALATVFFATDLSGRTVRLARVGGVAVLIVGRATFSATDLSGRASRLAHVVGCMVTIMTVGACRALRLAHVVGCPPSLLQHREKILNLKVCVSFCLGCQYLVPKREQHRI